MQFNSKLHTKVVNFQAIRINFRVMGHSHLTYMENLANSIVKYNINQILYVYTECIHV